MNTTSGELFIGVHGEEDELQALLADWTTFSDSCSQKQWNSPEESALLLKAPLRRISDFNRQNEIHRRPWAFDFKKLQVSAIHGYQ